VLTIEGSAAAASTLTASGSNAGDRGLALTSGGHLIFDPGGRPRRGLIRASGCLCDEVVEMTRDIG
jgi:hypothetical protein